MITASKEECADTAAALAGNNGFSLISNEKLLQLYTSLVKSRVIEERVRILSNHHEFDGSNTGAVGREASVVGVTIDLQPEDRVAPSRSNFLVNFIKGLRPDLNSSWLSARDAGRETPDYQLASAIELARSNKRKMNGKIVAVFRDGDAASIESWNEALALAGADRLPMLFVSHPSVQTSVDLQIGIPQSAARSHGLPSIPVDGSDVVAVYRVATETIAHARKGNGATLIECLTCDSDNLPETDPILKMEAYLNRKGLFREELKREVAGGFSREVDAAIDASEKMAISN